MVVGLNIILIGFLQPNLFFFQAVDERAPYPLALLLGLIVGVLPGLLFKPIDRKSRVRLLVLILLVTLAVSVNYQYTVITTPPPTYDS